MNTGARCCLVAALFFGVLGCAGSTTPGGGDDGGTDAGPDGGPDQNADSVQNWPNPICVWNQAYQENYEADTVAEILAGASGCYVLVDPFDSTEARDAIPQMKQKGNRVGCYISSGTCEDWRDDFNVIKPFCVDQQWGAWPGEYFVNVTDTGLVDVMNLRIDKMASFGCQMVEFDNMDWAFDSANRQQYGITATAADAEVYNQALCSHARQKGLGCMAKSSAQGAKDFDGLTVESYPDNKDWWTQSDLQDMLNKGGLGIIVHYNESDCQGVYDAYTEEYGNKLSFICEDKSLKKYVHFN